MLHQRARNAAETAAFSPRSTLLECLCESVIDYLHQFPKEGHLIAAISPHNSGIMAVNRPRAQVRTSSVNEYGGDVALQSVE